MNYKKIIVDALDVLRLNSKTIHHISQDKNATTNAIVIAVLSGVASGVGARSLSMIIPSAVCSIIGLFLMTTLIWVCANLLKGKSDYYSLLRPLGYAGIVGWLAAVPILREVIWPLIVIWMTVCAIMIVKTVFKFSEVRAAVTVLLPLIIIAVVLTIIGMIVGLGLLALLRASGVMISLH